MTTYIEYIDGDDWVALYLDGGLWAQGHELSSWDWLQLLAHLVPCSVVTKAEANYDTLLAAGKFPIKIDADFIDQDTEREV